jgi:hypothetical protein
MALNDDKSKPAAFTALVALWQPDWAHRVITICSTFCGYPACVCGGSTRQAIQAKKLMQNIPVM